VLSGFLVCTHINFTKQNNKIYQNINNLNKKKIKKIPQVSVEPTVSTFLDPVHLRQVEALAHSAQLSIAEQLQVPLTTEFPIYFIKVIYNINILKYNY
jgi:hypothetical protein